MTGEIIKDKKGNLFLQVNGGGSWSLQSIRDALNNLNFFKNNDELADLIYAAEEKMRKGETGHVSSEDANEID